MALKECKECGREISDLAISCPGCGCPQKYVGNIVFTDTPSKEAPKRNYAILKLFVNKLLILVFVLGGAFTVYHYDVGGLGSLVSSHTYLSSKVSTAERYLLDRIDSPKSYKKLEMGPMEKRYDYNQLGDVYITWIAYEFQDSFGGVKRNKAYFKIDAATEKVVDFKIR